LPPPPAAPFREGPSEGSEGEMRSTMSRLTLSREKGFRHKGQEEGERVARQVLQKMWPQLWGGLMLVSWREDRREEEE
jgi:hypothetical protein